MSTADLGRIGEGVRARLDQVHRAREEAFAASRDAIRHASKAVRAVHRGEIDQAEQALASSASSLEEVRGATADQPSLASSGLLSDAEKEYAEARLTLATTTDAALPPPETVGVADSAWLGGLAETVGELRRATLDRLAEGDLSRAEVFVERMDDIYALLVTIDYPEGVTGGLRRSTDVARGLLERTRGDVTTARLQDRLRVALDAHRDAVLGE